MLNNSSDSKQQQRRSTSKQGPPSEPAAANAQKGTVTVIQGYDQPKGSRHYVSPHGNSALVDEDEDDSSFDSEKMEAVDEMEGYGNVDDDDEGTPMRE